MMEKRLGFLARSVMAFGPLLLCSCAGSAGEKPGAAAPSPFLAENAAAMDKMMRDMDVQPTGDVDVDFVNMMVPHHQGAIDMAVAVMKYGKNEQIRRLAQEIIVTQQQEIAAMRLAVGQQLPPPPATAPATTRPAHSSETPSVHHHH